MIYAGTNSRKRYVALYFIERGRNIRASASGCLTTIHTSKNAGDVFDPLEHPAFETATPELFAPLTSAQWQRSPCFQLVLMPEKPILAHRRPVGRNALRPYGVPGPPRLQNIFITVA